MDHDSKAIRAEYLHREPRLCKTLQNWIRIKSVPYGFNLRITSSRIVGEGEGVHKSDKIHAHTIMMHSVQALYCD